MIQNVTTSQRYHVITCNLNKVNYSRLIFDSLTLCLTDKHSNQQKHFTMILVDRLPVDKQLALAWIRTHGHAMDLCAFKLRN